MPQQRGPQDPTNQTLPVTPGFVEPSTSVLQWDFLHQDTLYSDHQAEALPEEEVEEDSQEEVIPAEVAAFQVEEEDNSPNQEICTQETDLWAMPHSFTMETLNEPKNLWRPGSYTNG